MFLSVFLTASLCLSSFFFFILAILSVPALSVKKYSGSDTPYRESPIFTSTAWMEPKNKETCQVVEDTQTHWAWQWKRGQVSSEEEREGKIKGKSKGELRRGEMTYRDETRRDETRRNRTAGEGAKRILHRLNYGRIHTHTHTHSHTQLLTAQTDNC